MKNKYLRLAFVLLALAVITLACNRDVSPAFTVVEMNRAGDPMENGITWPKQEIPDLTYGSNYRLYIPSGYRNYIITDGSTTNPNGTVLGDRTDLIKLTLPSGIQIEVAASAFWQVNQSENAIREFIKFAAKFEALNTSMSGEGNVYSSTPGWNNMLLENFSPTMDSIAADALDNLRRNPSLNQDGSHLVIIDDDLWRFQDAEQKKALEDEMSRLFAADIRKRIGVSDLDLFCGSGDPTGWTDSDPQNAGKPGNEYYCAPVRIEVNSVSRAAAGQGDTGSQGLVDANQQRFEAAYELYGYQTNCWLGILDSIEACKGSSSPCTFIINDNACTLSNDDENTLILPNFPDTSTVPVEPTPTTTP